MNEHNLIPFSERSESEAREYGAKGGKKSGESRRRKKSMKQVMEMLLQMPASTREDYELLLGMGIDLEELGFENISNLLLVNAALLRRAKLGDVQAVKELRSIIEDDAALRHRIRYDNARLRLEKEKLQPPARETAAYKGLPAALVSPALASVLFDIEEHAHTEYVFPGGRGSTKSSFVGLNVVDLIEKHDTVHALVLRQFSNTLKDSVYAQIKWALSALGLEDEYSATKSPLEITKLSTGQKIYFRGADDPDKIKSIKPEFGYIGVLWFEELDQFHGSEEVRKIEQSAVRGGDLAFIFKTFQSAEVGAELGE